jgi:hypothetical protein
MRVLVAVALGLAAAAAAGAQTAEELVAKNLQARGGIDKIKAIRSLRMTGTLQAGGFKARIGRESAAPDLIRETFTIQGMTQITAYDGAVGWRVSPFGGRKDPESVGEEGLRELVEAADFYGPLVDYKEKGNRLEYLGHDTVDGDDAYRLKVTLHNGDIVYYYLDPDTYIEIRTEKVQFIRGSVRETFTNLGAYKLVAGVYFPFSLESGGKGDQEPAKMTFDKIEANVAIDPAEFRMPASTPKPAGGGQ